MYIISILLALVREMRLAWFDNTALENSCNEFLQLWAAGVIKIYDSCRVILLNTNCDNEWLINIYDRHVITKRISCS